MKRFSFFALSLMLIVGGCDVILKPPTPDPKPTPGKLPEEEVFDPAENITPGKALDGTWHVARVESGKFLMIQTATAGAAGAPPVYGAPEPVRLAGIMVPEKGQPGFEFSARTIHSWTDGRNDLTVEVDESFPYDRNGRKMVQIYFTSTSGDAKTNKHFGKKLNLNRMMVRSGSAAVDLNQATSIDVQKWLNDETYARLHTKADPKVKRKARPGPNDPPPPQVPDPLGLWKLGIYLGQRPTPVPTPAAAAPAAPPAPPAAPPAAPAKP